MTNARIDFNRRFTPIVGDHFPMFGSMQLKGIQNGEKVTTNFRTTETVSKWLVVHFFPRSFSDEQLKQVKAMDALEDDMIGVVGICSDSTNAMHKWLDGVDLKQLIVSDVSNEVALDCGIIASEFSEPANAVYLVDPYQHIKFAHYSEFPITNTAMISDIIQNYKQLQDKKEEVVSQQNVE